MQVDSYDQENLSTKIWTSSKNQTEHDQQAIFMFLIQRKLFEKEFEDKKRNKNMI